MDNQQLFMKNLNDFINYTEGVITIIGFNSEEYNKSNLKKVIANCKCSNCGSVFKMSLSNFIIIITNMFFVYFLWSSNSFPASTFDAIFLVLNLFCKKFSICF